jgi:hypothetical protein
MKIRSLNDKETSNDAVEFHSCMRRKQVESPDFNFEVDEREKKIADSREKALFWSEKKKEKSNIADI